MQPLAFLPSIFHLFQSDNIFVFYLSLFLLSIFLEIKIGYFSPDQERCCERQYSVFKYQRYKLWMNIEGGGAVYRGGGGE